jgi:Sulfotransferase family
MTALTEKPRVLYVMGAGRSGSTTLGITLGNCAGVLFAGELDNWLVRSGVPQVQDAERERFWSGVRAALDDPERAAALFGNEAQHAIERSLSLFRVHRWPVRYRLRRRYRAIAEDLYRALTRAAAVTHVADTSHYPLRAFELQHVAGIELYLVYLVRDPQGVVASFNRHDVDEYTKSTLHTNVYLWVTHLLSMFVFLRHPRTRRLLVRYEDFVADPGSVVSQILAGCGLSDATLPDFSALEIGVPLQGNRVTRERTLSLKRTTDSPRRSSPATRVVQAPLMAMLSRLRPSTRSRSGREGTQAATAT